MGDIVLLKDDSLKLHSWPLAKVTDVSLGPDGVVRVVTLTLPVGRTFTWHVRHLVPLMRASDCSPCPGGGRMSKIQGMDLEITTAAALRGHSSGHSSPKKITALPSNRTVNTSIELINTSIELINTTIEIINTSIELMQPLHSLSCMHLLLCSPNPKLLRNHLLSCYKRSSLPTRASLAFTCIHLHSLASPAFIAIVSSEDKEITLYKSSLVIWVSPTGLRA